MTEGDLKGKKKKKYINEQRYDHVNMIQGTRKENHFPGEMIYNQWILKVVCFLI